MAARQPVALVDFYAICNAKIPIIRRAANLRLDAVCRVKNRLMAVFGVQGRSATQRQGPRPLKTQPGTGSFLHKFSKFSKFIAF
jgi:hypothetical protein